MTSSVEVEQGSSDYERAVASQRRLLGALSRETGANCILDEVSDWFEWPAEELALGTQEIRELERRTTAELQAGRPNPRLLFDDERWPGVQSWLSMRKSAIALHTAYGAGEFSTLGQGLTADDFGVPLAANAATPSDALQMAIGAERSRVIVDQYRRFVETPLSSGLRRMFLASMDARAIRTRASAATRLIAGHEHTARDDGLVVASLACGAAAPMAEVSEMLAARGDLVSELYLIDHDPLALSCGKQVMTSRAHGAEVKVVLADLLDLQSRGAADLTPILGARKADVVDILGLFEYLPDAIAIDLLRKVREIVADDGVVVLGNMLDHRPEQVFFAQVMCWPRVRQRSPTKLLRLVREAGWSIGRVTLVIPERECVYAVAALRP